MSGVGNLPVVPLLEGQVSAASEVLSRAFQNDSLARYTIPDPEERARLLPFHFEAVVRYGLLAERVWTTPRVEGVIVCQPPCHFEMNPEALARSGILSERDRIGREAVDRFEGVTSYAEVLRRRDAGARHWYVVVIGVDPSRKGAGVGSTLLRHVLSLADHDRVPCYLETGQQENRAFYRKNGFKGVVEDVEPTSGLRFWTFRRAPASR